jgi:ABC-type transport system involved in multi-copper enzyme maturation permease subunit
MLGPVWHQVSLRGSRRPWLFLLRYGYAVGQVLLFLVLIDALRVFDPFRGFGESQQVRAGRLTGGAVQFLWWWPWLQALVTVLVSVPLVAGEVTGEKESGTLALLLTTPLESRHIIGGKLLGYGTQLLLVLLSGLPLYCFAVAWLDVPAAVAVGQLAVLVLRVYALGALALLLAVWSRSTRGAVVALVAVVGGGVAALLGARLGLVALAAAPEPDWAALGRVGLGPVQYLLDALDPLALAQATESAAAFGVRLVQLVLLYGGFGSVCLVLATLRLRPAYARQLEQPGRRAGACRPRPGPGDRPLYWREVHVTGLLPCPGRLPRWLPLAAVAVVVGLLAWVAFTDLFKVAAPGASEELFVAAVVAGVALVTGVRSAGAVTGERERGTWELLLLTPLPTPDIIAEKFQGILWASTPLVVACTAPAVVAALCARSAPVVVAGVLVLPAYLWFVQRWMIAVGLWFSSEARTNWRSLWSTLLFGFLIGGVVNWQCGGWFFLIVGGMPAKSSGLALVAPMVLAAWAPCAVLEICGRQLLKSAGARAATFERVRQRPLRRDRPE